uniref:BACK domain-containing protein n=1 Tax=Tetradesmus obliquus TaxID=3088 RepID=A0A383WH17_TETOB|eukprot:jgi/Sobl393_1/2728/SZX76710.1
MAYLANYFKRQDLSDIDVVIRLPRTETTQQVPKDITSPPLKRARREADEAADTDPLQLSSFPAHKLVMFSTEYIKAQGRHWQAQRSASDTCQKDKSRTPGGGKNEVTERFSVHLTIDSAEQLPAAEAVIAAMYRVPGAVSTLQQQQLVHAVVIADMVGVEVATEQAVKSLTTAAQSEQGLSAAALEALARLAAWPACLLQLLPTVLKSAPCCSIESSRVEDITAAPSSSITAAPIINRSMQQLLLGVFGDLDAACADKQLKQLLLSLPLPALQLLLSSDQLRVASEDTVLYVAQKYLDPYTVYEAEEEEPDFNNNLKLYEDVQAALAQLVRAPHLSHFALCCAALTHEPDSNSDHVLDGHLSQVQSLLSLKQTATTEQVAASIGDLEDVPASWLLGPRQIVPLADGVRLEWRLPVEQMRQACRDSFAQQDTVDIICPESSAPIGGLDWQLYVQCVQQGGGTVVGLYAGPSPGQLSRYMWYKCRFTVTWGGEQPLLCSRWSGSSNAAPTPGSRSRGFDKLFELDPMTVGGWDEAAWAAARLPTSGDMLLQLHIHSVG